MITGVDISKWQKGISIPKIKAEGFTHIILKAGGGDKGLYKDSQFDTFYASAKACGMTVVGAYFFGRAFSVEEAKKEANYFISLLQGKDIQYAFYDVEAKMLNQGYSHLTEICKTFLEVVSNAGYRAGIYASESQFNSRWNDSVLAPYTHWVAKYSSKKPKLKSGNNVDIWQYGGEINYIRSNQVAGRTVDQDYFYDTLYIDKPIIPIASLDGKSIHEIALEVLDGRYGNGTARMLSLGEYYNSVQKEVMAILKERSEQVISKTVDQLAVEVLAGVYGSGEKRKEALGSKYDEVQKRVNEIILERKQNHKTYVVVKGDTLSKIAERYSTTWQKLAEVNNITDPNKLYIGQELYIQ